MKRLPFNGKGVSFIPVQRIIYYGMPDISHMHANLVSPSCLQTTLYQRIVTEPLQYSKMCNRIFAVLHIDGHFNAVLRMSSQGCINTPLCFHNIAVNESHIGASCRMALNLFRQAFMCRIGFSRYHKPRCIFVQSMNNAGTNNTVNPRQLAAAMP